MTEGMGSPSKQHKKKLQYHSLIGVGVLQVGRSRLGAGVRVGCEAWEVAY